MTGTATILSHFMYIFCAIRLYFIFGVIVKMAFIISVGSVINVVVLLLTSLPVRTHTHTRSFSHACGCVCVCVCANNLYFSIKQQKFYALFRTSVINFNYPYCLPFCSCFTSFGRHMYWHFDWGLLPL